MQDSLKSKSLILTQKFIKIREGQKISKNIFDCPCILGYLQILIKLGKKINLHRVSIRVDNQARCYESIRENVDNKKVGTELQIRRKSECSVYLKSNESSV